MARSLEELVPLIKEALERGADMPLAPLTPRQLAEQLGISVRTLKSYGAVRRYGVPELVAMIDAGTLRVEPASWIIRLPPEQQREEIAKGPERVRHVASLLREFFAKRRLPLCRTCGQLIRRKR
jgi:hypothetical protein